MKEELIRVNDNLTILVKVGHKGAAAIAYYKSERIGKKPVCMHTDCMIRFVADMALAADQMDRLDNALIPKYEHLN